MKNFLNKKILIILTIFAIILGFGSTAFASYTLNYNNTTYTFANDIEFDNYIITYQYVNDHIYFNLYSFDDIVDKTEIYYSNDIIYYGSNNGSIVVYCIDNYDEGNDTFYYLTSYNDYGTFGVTGHGVYIAYTSFDIKDQNGNVVFQGAPQEQATILAAIVEQAETERVTTEIVGILPLVLILLVSIIATYKAIRFLQRGLRAS